MKKYIAYYRVSTGKQGDSGLGLEAQQREVKSFIGDNELIQEFTEIESGTNNKRKILQEAIFTAKENKAILVIAKLDRLSRNASFILALRDSKIEFVCCDMPEANIFTIGIFALLAQQESDRISKRVKAANLSKQIRQGENYKHHGYLNLKQEGRMKGIEIRNENSRIDYKNKRAITLIKSLLKQNLSLQEIANELNNNDFTTITEKQFHKTSVLRLIKKFNIEYQPKATKKSETKTTSKSKTTTNENNKKAFGFIQSLKTQNLSLTEIANKLNEFGFTTSTNKEFNKVNVFRIINNFNNQSA